MCIVTDHNHVVQGKYLIRGVDPIPEGWHAYECFDTPVSQLPSIGDTFTPDNDMIIGGDGIPRAEKRREIFLLETKRLSYLAEVRRIEDRLAFLRMMS